MISLLRESATSQPAVITGGPTTKLAISRSILRDIWVSHLAAFTVGRNIHH